MIRHDSSGYPIRPTLVHPDSFLWFIDTCFELVLCVPGTRPYPDRLGGITVPRPARIPMKSSPNVGDSSDSCPIATPYDKLRAPNLFGFSISYKIVKKAVA